MKHVSVLKTLFAASLSLAVTSALADPFTNYTYYAQQRLSQYTLDCAHWYVAGNMGVSHLFDKPAPGSGDSVAQNGPGWDAALGYQFNSIIGTELGYTQYYNSEETLGSTIVARTQHYAVHLNATGRAPLAHQFSVLGKLGIAYSHAEKMFTGGGGSGSAAAVSAYYGLGLDYSITPTVDMVLQWARARGNNFTGSSDLYSLGMVFGIA